VTEAGIRMLRTLLEHLEVWVNLFRGEDAMVMQRDINNLKFILVNYPDD